MTEYFINSNRTTALMITDARQLTKVQADYISISEEMELKVFQQKISFHEVQRIRAGYYPATENCFNEILLKVVANSLELVPIELRQEVNNAPIYLAHS